jgi:hypothetical protein
VGGFDQIDFASGDGTIYYMKVWIQGLSLLPESGDYIKIGGTDTHHGPPPYPDDDNNHHGTAGTIASLQQIASEYLACNQCPAPPQQLQINDISLYFGGVFDISMPPNWAPPHTYHRLGLDVDIRTKGGAVPDNGEPFTDQNRNGFYDPGEPFTDRDGNGVYTWGNRDYLRQIILRNGAMDVRLEFRGGNNEHIHIYYW